MQLQSTSYNDVFNDVAKKLATRTGINNFGQSSKANTIITSLLNENKNNVSIFNSLLDSLSLSSATDSKLDAIGDFLGLKRLDTTRAITKASDNNFEFYVDAGTFGDINSGSPISIPANTIVYLDNKDSNSGSTIEFRLTTSVSLGSGSSSQFCAIEALQPGTFSNVAAYSINKCSFTNYTLSSQNKLKVRNNFSIVNGRDRQQDSSYRVSLSKVFTAFATANETSLKLAIISFPGVKELKFIRNYNGIGTSAFFIDTFEGTVSNSLLTNIRERLSLIGSASGQINTYSPKYISCQFDLVIKTINDMNNIDKQNLNNSITLLIKNYFSNLSIGQALDLNDLFLTIIRSNNRIAQIGRVANQSKAESVSIYFSDSFGNYSNKTLISNSLSIDQEQKFILLESETPITISIEKL